jgi:hypothetical protein
MLTRKIVQESKWDASSYHALKNITSSSHFDETKLTSFQTVSLRLQSDPTRGYKNTLFKVIFILNPQDRSLQTVY